jgi:membrane protease YdiL (CAAX protease family)
MDKCIGGALNMAKLSKMNFGKVNILGKSAENLEAQEDGGFIYQGKETLAGILFLLILLPESFIYSGNFEVALLLYAGILTALSLISIFVKETKIHNICQVFALLPIFRLINFSIPTFQELGIFYFIFIYAPMILPILIILASQELTREQLGLNFKKMWYYIPVSILIGFILGQGESSILETALLIQDLSILNITVFGFIMIFYVGLIEEIMFRSLLQTRLEESFGIWSGLLLSSLLFGLMNSGYGSIYEILYGIFVGLVIGFVFQKTRSLPFIVMIHGFINVFSFGIIPYLGHGYGFF